MNPDTNYSLDEYLNDVTTALFKAPKGGRLSDNEQSLQATAIALMMRSSGLVASSKSSASLTAQTDALNAEDTLDELPLSFPCSCGMNHSTEFARFNLGLPTLTKDQLGALMTGRLRKVLSLYKSRRASAVGSTKDFYDYQILLIERIFEN